MAETRRRLFVVVYSHKHGLDAWPVVRRCNGTEKAIKAMIKRIERDTKKELEAAFEELFDPDNEWIEVRGPWPIPEK
jgi:hypothetical protein